MSTTHKPGTETVLPNDISRSILNVKGHVSIPYGTELPVLCRAGVPGSVGGPSKQPTLKEVLGLLRTQHLQPFGNFDSKCTGGGSESRSLKVYNLEYTWAGEEEDRHSSPKEIMSLRKLKVTWMG